MIHTKLVNFVGFEPIDDDDRDNDEKVIDSMSLGQLMLLSQRVSNRIDLLKSVHT
jgi:hypothetical protein